MKKKILLFGLSLSLLFLWACSNNAQNQSESDQASVNSEALPSSSQEVFLDEALFGVWASAHEGERGMVERLYFYESGELKIELDYEGSLYATLYGDYRVGDHSVLCSITEGASPYAVSYDYRIDGRTLILTDDDGPAEYLRTS